jgi:hypothetical protein
MHFERSINNKVLAMYKVFPNFRSVFLSALLLAVPTVYSGEEQEAIVTQHVLAQINSQLDIEVEAIDGAVQSEVFPARSSRQSPGLSILMAVKKVGRAICW